MRAWVRTFLGTVFACVPEIFCSSELSPNPVDRGRMMLQGLASKTSTKDLQAHFTGWLLAPEQDGCVRSNLRPAECFCNGFLPKKFQHARCAACLQLMVIGMFSKKECLLVSDHGVD